MKKWGVGIVIGKFGNIRLNKDLKKNWETSQYF